MNLLGSKRNIWSQENCVPGLALPLIRNMTEGLSPNFSEFSPPLNGDSISSSPGLLQRLNEIMKLWDLCKL